MSSNQKQAVAGGPQSRFPTPYQPVHTNRTDILVAPSGYVGQGNQAGNQGPAIRGIAPAGPPNQASTPPNTDLKVQQIPQQASMSPIYISRPQGAFYQARASGPPSQAQRMPNHNNRPQQPPVYGQPATQFMMSPAFIMTNQVPYYPPQRPQTNYVQPPMTMYSGPPAAVAYPSFQASQPQVPFYYNPSMLQRGTSIPQPQPANPNPPQTAISSGAPLVKTQTQAPAYQQQRTQNRQRRPNAIAIIDPNTGEDQLDKIYDEDSSHPPSGESSARETPQPNPNLTHKQEVQATFAKMVFQALQDDSAGPHVIPEEVLPERQHTEPSPVPYTLPPQPQVPPQQQQQSVVQQNAVKDHIVSSSKLQPMAKVFEPPVVSANCDSVEVTLPNKLPKDRESPVKRSKPKEQLPPPREHRDSLKESSVKEPVSDKQSSIVKDPEVKPKEVSSSNATNLSQVPAPSKDSIKDNNNQSQDKRGQRKDSTKSEVTSAPSIETSDIAEPTSPVHTTQPIPDAICNAKSKPNASRSSSKQPIAPSQQQQSQPPATVQNSSLKQVPPVVVPPPQPAKPSNKSHKKNELNQKGASKEGTDMDAFNDNVAPQEEVNANIASKPTNNDIINANSVPLVNNNSAAPVKDVNVNIEANKTFDSNDLTIKSELTKPIKTKIDITDIVKDTPKPIIKRTIESHDETDRAAISNDKLVQAKNEANSKTNDNTLENKLPYKDGQWTPNNPDGMKVYDKSFLLALQNIPSSRTRPDNIPDGLLADERGRLPDGRPSMGGRVDMPNPPYNNYGGKSGSQRGPPPQRNSKNKINEKRKQPSMKLSLSVREDVKLNESDNAWRPARLNKGENATDDDKKTEELYKKVRGVLNKLTPQKFETLLSQIKALQIDTQSRLQGVIDLVFEKAVDEPNFSVAYASMCNELALMQVPTPSSTPEKPEVVNFRKLLINRCQVEFEKQSHDESVRLTKLKEIEECNDAEKKKDLQFELDDYDRKLRMKSVGNIRFIGELFKQNMLTVNIMMKCLKNLLDNKDEESLECLCKLLTTIGKELESNRNVDLSNIFTTMKNIADKKEGNVSSRIRFMLHDVIDLKNSKWVPRRQDHNPKTIDQIQKEADQEQYNINVMHSGPSAPRRDDRVGSMGSGQNTLDRKGNRGNRNNSSDPDGWQTSNRQRATQFNIQSDKLKNKTPLMDEPLGNPLMYGSWSKGSGVGSLGKPQPQSLGTIKGNMFAALQNMDTESRTFGQRPGSKEPYSSKGPSMERSYGKYDGSGSRSGSQHRSNDSSSSQRTTPAPVPPISRPPAPATPQQTAAPTMPALTEDKMERRISNCADEFVNGNCTVDDFYVDISSVIPVSFYARMVGFMCIRVLEKNQHIRLRTGYLLAKLVKQGNVSLDDYCTGLEEVLSQGDDLVIDVPKIWDYIAEILVDLICEEALSIDTLKKCLSIIGPSNSATVLAPLFKLVVEKNGAVFLQSIWKKSGARLSDFIDSSEVDRFVADNHLEFLTGSTASIQTNLSYSLIEEKLLELFKSNADLDTVVEWIKTNMGDNVNQSKFIRTLATAVFRDSIDANFKLSNDRLSQHINLLTKYVDNKADYELQCLFALQALIQKLEHPQGLLLSICDKLYELGAFSQESFIAWENNNDPAEQEGKGVAIKQLTSFFTQLKENDDEESDESDVA